MGEKTKKLLTRNVEEICFVVVHHELDDDPGILAEVLEADDPHDVGSILGIRVLAVLVGQNQTSISLVNLGATKVDRSAPGT